jgi:hypothetical protein
MSNMAIPLTSKSIYSSVSCTMDDPAYFGLAQLSFGSALSVRSPDELDTIQQNDHMRNINLAIQLLLPPVLDSAESWESSILEGPLVPPVVLPPVSWMFEGTRVRLTDWINSELTGRITSTAQMEHLSEQCHSSAYR